jgi:hypothetical protein
MGGWMGMISPATFERAKAGAAVLDLQQPAQKDEL